MPSIKPCDVNSIFTDSSNPAKIKSDLACGFLNSIPVTRILDSIKSSVTAADIVICRDSNGELEWRVAGDKLDLTQKASWVPFWIRRIVHWWKSGTPEYDRKLTRKIDEVTAAFLQFNQVKIPEPLVLQPVVLQPVVLQPVVLQPVVLQQSELEIPIAEVSLPTPPLEKKDWRVDLPAFFLKYGGDHAAPLVNLIQALFKDRIEAFTEGDHFCELTLKPGCGTIFSIFPLEIPNKMAVNYDAENKRWQVMGEIKATCVRELDLDQAVVKCEQERVYINLQTYPWGTGYLKNYNYGQVGMSFATFNKHISDLKVSW